MRCYGGCWEKLGSSARAACMFYYWAVSLPLFCFNRVLLYSSGCFKLMTIHLLQPSQVLGFRHEPSCLAHVWIKFHCVYWTPSPFLSFFLFFKTGFFCIYLFVMEILCRSDYFHLRDSPASAFQVLGLEKHAPPPPAPTQNSWVLGKPSADWVTPQPSLYSSTICSLSSVLGVRPHASF